MVDYSSWEKIELSSDEDEVHPFIENRTLFRLKHEARLERMKERKQEEMTIELQKANVLDQLKKLDLKKSVRENAGEKTDDLLLEYERLNAEQLKLVEKENALKKKVLPWNVDTICKDAFSTSTMINSKPKDSSEADKFPEFVRANEAQLQLFGLLTDVEQAEHFLLSHLNLACENSLYYLLRYGHELHLQKKHDDVKKVASQIVLLHCILTFKDDLYTDMVQLIHFFFDRVRCNLEQFRKDIEDNVKYIEHEIIKKAESNQTVLETAQQEESDESELQNTPELDPEEVFNSLPEEMQTSYVNADRTQFLKIVAQLPPKEARHHMERCVKAGLWIPEK